MYVFNDKQELLTDLQHKAAHHRHMQKRWLDAIDDREPGGKVYFAYLHPVGVNAATIETVRHGSAASAYEDAYRMVEGLQV